jgi:hypothetical protein
MVTMRFAGKLVRFRSDVLTISEMATTAVFR